MTRWLTAPLEVVKDGVDVEEHEDQVVVYPASRLMAAIW
jgi:hypothetical protein